MPCIAKAHASIATLLYKGFIYSEILGKIAQEEASLRAEAEAPFRSLRIVLFGFGLVSAALATLFSIPTLIGSVGGAINAKPLAEALQDIGINVSALTICGFLLKGDLDAREKQMARLMREDQLGTCQIELANGKILRLGQLRGSVRPVIVVGTEEQVAQAVAAAEPLREKLAERGLMIVAVPMYQRASNASGAEDDNSAAAETTLSLPPLTEDDLRWRANPIRIGEWKAWFDEQAAASNKGTGQGLYVGLRLDGRVRASGRGCPPWDIFAAQLPPVEGFFSGLWDGMDGRV